ncbi:MAG TPA: S-layer homology domain-containing protein [Clostridia bacterium]|nr:S-layer homology domain-containing protein [Clostridia bacterium]
MKRLLYTFLLILVLCLGTWQPLTQVSAAEDLGAYSWTGEWKTSWGDMTLTQTGEKVTGTYTFDSGKIVGTVSGNVLTGTWSESPSYSPPHDAGEVEFVISEDGKSFTGKWRYGSEGDWGNWEGGTRNTEVILAPSTGYSNASSWARTELDKAGEYGLIPDSLKGADMTKPITREEFAELAVKLYEKTTGTAATAASSNPFTDTTNPEILKAFKVGVTTGTSATTFAPKELTNREQVATMLSRAIRVMAPGGDFSTEGAPTFTDRKDISSWALDHVLFMSRLGIIKGTGGKFMPKAVTTAEKATGYATTTREMAVAMSVRAYEQMDTIKASEPSSAAVPKPTPPPAPAVSEKVAADAKDMADWLIGTWGYSTSNRNVHLDIMYEFKKDGTFYRVTAPLVMYVRTGNVFEGKYRISGDKLILSDILKSIGLAQSHFDKIWYFTMESYTSRNVQWEDEEFQISRTDDGTLMIGDIEFNRGR